MTRLKNFLARILWEVADDFLLPKPLKYCYLFYECFYLAPASEQTALLEEARRLDQIAAATVVNAVFQERPRDLPPTTDNPTLRTVAGQLVNSLSETGKAVRPGQNSAEALRQVLNRYVTSSGGQALTRPKLSPDQRSVGRLATSALLMPGRTGQPQPSTTPPAIAGYDPVRLLGSGGFGDVYLMRHLQTGQSHAVKVVRFVDDPGRLDREIKTLRRVQSQPHLVGYLADGNVDGIPWIAMEYIRGVSLAQMLSFPGTRPNTEQALILAEQTLLGLNSLHRLGILHRDLKPDNIMLDEQYRVRLIDFGLAKPIHPTGQSAAVTRSEAILGTIAYMPLEQLTGEPNLSPSVDIWAFGVLLYQLLTGELPYPGANFAKQALEISARDANVTRPEIPAEIQPFLRRCLNRAADQRFSHAEPAVLQFQPLVAQARKRLRHERFRASWIPILDGRLLERFALVHTGPVSPQSVEAFARLAGEQGVAEVDEIRLQEILPAILAEAGKIPPQMQALSDHQARCQRAWQESTPSPAALREAAEELDRLQGRVRDAEAGLTAVVRQVLAEEVANWNDLLAAEQERERQKEREKASEEAARQAAIRQEQFRREAEEAARRAEAERRTTYNERLNARFTERLDQHFKNSFMPAFWVFFVVIVSMMLIARSSADKGPLVVEKGMLWNTDTYPKHSENMNSAAMSAACYGIGLGVPLLFLVAVLIRQHEWAEAKKEVPD